MFGLFTGRLRAREVATSLGRLLDLLSTERDELGPIGVERLVRRLGSSSHEENEIGGRRVVKASVPIGPNSVQFGVTLMTGIDSHQKLLIDGQGEYAGFTLRCSIPPGIVIVDLQPGWREKIRRHGRLLYAEYRITPNVIGVRQFR